jgi:hypothetical protein
MADDEFKYRAFLSCSREDNHAPFPADGEADRRCWGDWLNDALQHFSIPAEFIGQINSRGEIIPERIPPVFLHETESSGDAALSAEAQQALTESRCLIVICSPRSAKDVQVNETVRAFKQLGRGKYILPLVIAGEPDAGDGHRPGKSADDECFVPALRHPVSPEGTIDFTRRAERYLFVDARHGAEKREIPAKDHANAEIDLETARIQLIALLLGVGFNGLWAREQKRHFVDLTEAQQRTQAALEQIEAVRRESRETQARILETQNLPPDVHRLVEEAQNKTQAAQDQFHEIQQQFQELQNKDRETQSQLEEARNRVVVAENKILAAENQLRDAQLQAEQTGQQLEEARRQFQEIQSQVSSTPPPIPETPSPTDDVHRLVEEAQNKALAAQDQFREVQQQFHELQNKNRETQSQLEEARNQVVVAESKIQAAENQVREVQLQAEQAGLQLQEIRRQSEQQPTVLQTADSSPEVHRQMEEAQNRASAAQHQFREIEKQFQELQNKDREAQSQLEAARNQILATESKILAAENLARDAQLQAEQTGQQLQAAQNQSRKERSEILEVQRQTAEAGRQLQEIQSLAVEAQSRERETQNKIRQRRRLTGALAVIAVLALLSAGVATDIAWSQKKAVDQARANAAATVWEPDLTHSRLDREQIRQALLRVDGMESAENRRLSVDKLSAWIPENEISETLSASSILWDERQRDRFRKRLLIRLGWVNPLSAMTEAGAIPGKIVDEDGGSDSAIYFQLAVLDNWVKTDLPCAFAWVCGLSNAADQERAFEKILPALDAVQPPDLLAQLNALKATHAGPVYTLLFQHWAAQDPVAAFRLWRQMPDHAQDGNILPPIVAAWLTQPPPAALNWMKSQPDILTAIETGWLVWRAYDGKECPLNFTEADVSPAKRFPAR